MFQLKPSFAGGELAPALYGRIDLAKYDVGAAEIENMIVLRYGGVSRRPGFRYVAQTYNNGKARLLPFRYSSDQNYIVEVTAGRFRFYTEQGIVVDGGGNPYSIANDFTESELADIKYTQSADTLFLTHPNHYPMTLVRNGSADWEFGAMDITGGPFEDMVRHTAKITPSGTTGPITLTASANYFKSNMVGCLMALEQKVNSQKAEGVPGTDTLEVDCAPGATVFVETFGFWTGTISISKYDADAVAWVVLRTQHNNHSQNYQFQYTNETDGIVKYKVTSADFNPAVWEDENPNQTGKVVIQTFSSDYEGIVEITGYTDRKHVNATVVRELASSAGTRYYALSAWSSNTGYPACCGFFEDRFVLAGTRTDPQTFWMSQTGDYYNFAKSIPQVDTDAITGTLNNGQMNGIQHLATFGELLLQTAGGTYKVSGGDKPITPSNMQSKPQEYRGINNLTPCLIGGRIVFVQEQGNIVRDLGYTYDSDKYEGDDVSLLAAHLFEHHTLKSMTYQQVPNSIVWCVREDGVLLGMTYVKEQDVYAWHKHTTNGKFVDVCSISGENEDELWAVVKRGANYYVEVMEAQVQEEEAAEQYFVDGGYHISGNTRATITGLNWLAGKTVQILGDGNVLPEQEVAGDGSLALGRVYSELSIGLGYVSILKTLPVEMNAADGTLASRKKRIARLMMMFRKSRGGWYGLNEGKLDEIKWRSSENWSAPIQLYTGKQYVTMPQSSYEDTLQVTVKQLDPLPMNIIAIVPEVAPGG